MRDAGGNLVTTRLAGPTTLRFTVLPEALDIDYLAFVVADGCDTIKFSRDGNGNLVLTWGGYGAPDGSLIFPRDVTVTPDGNTVVVTDSENNRLDLFTPAGVFVNSVKPGSACQEMARG